MRVSTGVINAPIGSLVHIQGRIRVDSPENETQSGVLVSDSLGGESLGQLISSVDAPQNSWQKFGLFRLVSNADGFQVHFETRGRVTASITDIKAEVIQPERRVRAVRFENDSVSRVKSDEPFP